jgi:hypothetical protein
MPKIPPRDSVEGPFVISQEMSEHDESVFLLTFAMQALTLSMI